MTTPKQPMNRDQAYRLALILEARARLDARTWIARLPRQLSLLARGRADQIIDTARTEDPLRTAFSREWYVRVFTDHARHQLGLGQPGVEVTPTETEHLAECLRTGVAYRIHGPAAPSSPTPADPPPSPDKTTTAKAPTAKAWTTGNRSADRRRRPSRRRGRVGDRGRRPRHRASGLRPGRSSLSPQPGEATTISTTGKAGETATPPPDLQQEPPGRSC